MDRTGADFEMSVQTIIDRLAANPIPIQLPIGSEGDFLGIIDLVENHAVIYHDDLGKEVENVPIPADYADAAAEAREHMLEEVSKYDDGPCSSCCSRSRRSRSTGSRRRCARRPSRST